MIARLAAASISDVTIDDIHLVTDDGLDRLAPALLQQLNGTIHHTMIGEGNSRHLQLSSPLHQIRDLTRPIQQAVITVNMQADKAHRGLLGIGLHFRRETASQSGATC